jgi:hypothetical protein
MSKRVADESDVVSVKKPRQKKVKGIEGISEEDFKNTDALLVKKLLITGHVKQLIKLVKADWHDGYEEQGEEIGHYKASLGPILQAIYNISVIGEKEFVRCHEVIKVVAESWINMEAVPMRGSVSDDFISCDSIDLSVEVPGNGATAFYIRNGNEIAGEIWTRFLLAAASSTNSEKVSDEQLAQFIKDASDYEVKVLDPIVDRDAGEECFDRNAEQTAQYTAGLARLTTLFNDKSKWEDLDTCRSKGKRIKVVDRRFSGPKHLRTRDYDSGDGGDY